MRVQTVTIIHEPNCHESHPSLLDRLKLKLGLADSVACLNFSSVWLAFPPFDPERDDQDYAKMATKITGPIPTEDAEAIIRQLQDAFMRGGFQTRVEICPDD